MLGGLLLDNEGHDRIGALVANDFYRDDHRIIFEHICRLIECGKPADVITVYTALSDEGMVERSGGLPYLNALAANTPSAANIARYAEIVQARSTLRQLVKAGYQIADSGMETRGREPDQLLDEAEARIFAIAESRSRGTSSFLEIQPLLTGVVERIDVLYQQSHASGLTGLSTGFVDLDEKTAGLQPGELVVVAGRPSMGKTAFAVNIAEFAAVESGLPVVVFSMEMSGAQLALRMIGSIGRIDQNRLQVEKLGDDDWPRLTMAITKLQDTRIYIDESGSLDIYQIRSRTRQLMRKTGPLALIVVDYIQLVSGTGRTSIENRAAELAQVSRGLKGLAKEMACPVLALSQLNRAVDARADKRPLMSDLRESGAIEQDADVILFIYRDEQYNRDSADRGVAEIIIGKQRNGPTGTVKLSFEGKFTKFGNLALGR